MVYGRLWRYKNMRKMMHHNQTWEYTVGKSFVLVRNKDLGKRILVQKKFCPQSAYYACNCCGFQFWKNSIEESQKRLAGWDHRIYLQTSIKPHHIKQLIEYHIR